MQDDRENLTPQGSEENSKVARRLSKDWVPHEAKLLFASLIQQVTQDQFDEAKARQAELDGQEKDEGTLPVGDAGPYEMEPAGDDGAASSGQKDQLDVEDPYPY